MMKDMMKLLAAVVIMFMGLSFNSYSALWKTVEKECPVCGTVNEFKAPGNTNVNIFESPAKFQYLFWPETEPEYFYCCKKCFYTATMDDFDKKMPEKVKSSVKHFLKDVTMPEYKDSYLDAPLDKRMLVAEKIYNMSYHDDYFMCKFYRIKGYHYDKQGNRYEAEKARKNALAIVYGMQSEKKNYPILKELYYISGAMNYFLGNKQAALDEFRNARPYIYQGIDLKPEQAESYNLFLENLLQDFTDKLRNEMKNNNSGHGK